MRVAACQMDVQRGRTTVNRSKILTLLQTAIEQDSELTVFPECATSGYCFDSQDAASQAAIPADSDYWTPIQQMLETSRRYSAIGFLESNDQALFNSVMILGPDQFRHLYRKTHLPHLGVDRFVQPNPGGFPVADLPIGKIGINICYDQRFPESARVSTLNGAQLILVPTNEPDSATDVCDLLTRARAFENHVYYLWVNRVGTEGGTTFMGSSQLVGPTGETLFRLSPQDEAIHWADIDLTVADQKKQVKIPGAYEIDLLRDRFPPAYAPIAKEK